jgi:hypothetical protein
MMSLDDMYDDAASTPAPRPLTIPSREEIDALLKEMEAKDNLKPAPTGADEEFPDDDEVPDGAPSYQEVMLDLEHALKVLGDVRDLLGFITLEPDTMRTMDLATAVQVHKVLKATEDFLAPWEQL